MQEFQAFLASTPVFAFFILCALYAIGEFIGTYTKAWIPSVFIIAILFLVGYWTFLPSAFRRDYCNHVGHYSHGYGY